MNSERDKIFSSIKSALDTLPERSEYPGWSDALPVSNHLRKGDSLKDLFAERLTTASGVFLDKPGDLITFLMSNNAVLGYCDIELAGMFEDAGGLTIETRFDMEKIDDYQFGITRASCAIAESGTLVLKDGETSARLAALAPWIHVAVVKESDIVPSPQQAIERFDNAPTIIFCTGPSKTADVEGILIQGVHGPGIQVALVIP